MKSSTKPLYCSKVKNMPRPFCPTFLSFGVLMQPHPQKENYRTVWQNSQTKHVQQFFLRLTPDMTGFSTPAADTLRKHKCKKVVKGAYIDRERERERVTSRQYVLCGCSMVQFSSANQYSLSVSIFFSRT